MTSATPQHSQPQVFHSAIDWWIAALLFLSPVLATAVGVVLLIDGRPADASLLFLIAAIILLLTVGLTLPCRYTLLDDALSIRCGLICYQIALADILEVAPSASLRSGPALSLRRVRIRTDRRTHLVSPRDRDHFITELQLAICETKIRYSPNPCRP